MGISAIIGGVIGDVGAGAAVDAGVAAGVDAGVAGAADAGIAAGADAGVAGAFGAASAGDLAAADVAAASGADIAGVGAADIGAADFGAIGGSSIGSFGDAFGAAGLDAGGLSSDLGIGDIGSFSGDASSLGDVSTYGGGDATLGSSTSSNIGSFAGATDSPGGLSSGTLSSQADQSLASLESGAPGTPTNPTFDVGNTYGAASPEDMAQIQQMNPPGTIEPVQGVGATNPIDTNILGPGAETPTGYPAAATDTSTPFGTGAQNLTQGNFGVSGTGDPLAGYPSANVGAYPGSTGAYPGSQLVDSSGNLVDTGQQFVQAPGATGVPGTAFTGTTPTAVAGDPLAPAGAPAATGPASVATTTVPASAVPGGAIPGSVAAPGATAAPAAAGGFTPSLAGGIFPPGVSQALTAASLGVGVANLVNNMNQPGTTTYAPGYYPYASGGGAYPYYGYGSAGGGYSTPQPNDTTQANLMRLSNALVQGQGDPLALQNSGMLNAQQAQALSGTYNSLLNAYAQDHNMSPQSVSPMVRNIIANEALSQSGTIGGQGTTASQAA